MEIGIPNGPSMPMHSPERVCVIGDAPGGGSTSRRPRRDSWKRRRRSSSANLRFDALYVGLNSSKQTYTINPNRRWKVLWDWFIIVLVVYNSVSVPFTSAFASLLHGPAAEHAAFLDVFIDVLFAVDIAFTFRTEVPLHQGEVCTDGGVIARKYLRGWFAVDLLASIPFDAMFAAMLGSTQDKMVTNMLPLLKSMRLFRLGRLLRKLDQLSAADFLRIVKLMFTYTIIVHWFACVWFFTGHTLMLAGDDNSWILVTNMQDESLNTLYTVSFHFATTTVLPGSGTVRAGANLERTVHTAMMVMGALMNAFVFGNVASLIHNFDQSHGRYKNHLETIKGFCTHYQAPQQLRQRLIAYMEHHLNIHGFYDITEVVKPLPRHLKYDVYSFVYEQLISSTTMFAGAHPSFIRMLVSRLVPIVCGPGEVLIGIEDPVQEMFFVQRGIAAVISPDDEVLGLLHPGSPVGHLALLQGERSRDTYVRATEVCVLARLDKSDFEQCLAAFPEHVERLRHYCQDELRQRREEGRTRHRNSEESSWKKSVVTLCRAASFSISNNLSKLTTRRSSSQRSGSKGTLFGDWSPKGKNGVVRKHDHSQDEPSRGGATRVVNRNQQSERRSSLMRRVKSLPSLLSKQRLPDLQEEMDTADGVLNPEQLHQDGVSAPSMPESPPLPQPPNSQLTDDTYIRRKPSSPSDQVSRMYKRKCMKSHEDADGCSMVQEFDDTSGLSVGGDFARRHQRSHSVKADNPLLQTSMRNPILGFDNLGHSLEEPPSRNMDGNQQAGSWLGPLGDVSVHSSKINEESMGGHVVEKEIGNGMSARKSDHKYMSEDLSARMQMVEQKTTRISLQLEEMKKLLQMVVDK